MKHLGNTVVDVIKNCPSEAFKQKLQKYISDTREHDLDEDFGNDILRDFGGYFYVIESNEEFKQIETAVWSESLNRYFTLDEIAASFDICETLEDEFVHILLITNNSGGHTYLIPTDFSSHPNVVESIKLTADSYSNS